MHSLAHMLEGNCEDADCELHHMDVAVEEQVASDIHRAAFLAGVEWALCRSARCGYHRTTSTNSSATLAPSSRKDCDGRETHTPRRRTIRR
jgi:hypothetical protein